MDGPTRRVRRQPAASRELQQRVNFLEQELLRRTREKEAANQTFRGHPQTTDVSFSSPTGSNPPWIPPSSWGVYKDRADPTSQALQRPGYSTLAIPMSFGATATSSTASPPNHLLRGYQLDSHEIRQDFPPKDGRSWTQGTEEHLAVDVAVNTTCRHALQGAASDTPVIVSPPRSADDVSTCTPLFLTGHAERWLI